MREVLRAHSHSFAGLAFMVALALVMGGAAPSPLSGGAPITSLPKAPIDLPGPGQDADGDSYGNGVDLYDGDLHVRITVHELHLRDASGLPQLLVGTQDDHWRLGKDRELAWPHVVDHDPLGRTPGSPGWWQDVVRTGAWWYSPTMEGASKALAPTGNVSQAGDGFDWPIVFNVNVRDDRDVVNVALELYDVEPDPDRRDGAWMVSVDAGQGIVQADDGQSVLLGQTLSLTRGEALLRISVETHTGINRAEAAALAAKWAPTMHFDSSERFYPVPGRLLEQFHGFAETTPDHRTWTRDFTNARDAYVLYLADFNGDRIVDHKDGAALTDILSAGGQATPTVYSSVTLQTGDQVVIQYWFLYMYNFVQDESSKDIPFLAHNGDREFIQLTFDSIEDARLGWPSAVSYSQHYKGIRVPVEPGTGPFSNTTHPDVYVAAGSHASYPVAGDDRRFRPGLAGFGDFFDGQGDVWSPDEPVVELLSGQKFHQGHLWGPITRHHRDLGTSLKPLLQHSFSYAFIDPLTWEHRLMELQPDELNISYGGSS